MKSLSIRISLLTALLCSSAVAHADSTIVFAPAAGEKVKERHLKRVAKSFADILDRDSGITLSKKTAGQAADSDAFLCSLDAECLARAGRAEGATRAVGVALSRNGSSFDLFLVIADVSTGREVSRTTVRMNRKELASEAGLKLVEFMAMAPAQAPPPEDLPDIEPELEPGAEPEPEPEPEPEAEPAPAAMPEPTATPEPAPEPAQPSTEASLSASTDPEPRAPTLHIGLHTGVVLPQISSELATTAGVKLEFGYRVWKNLSPVLGVGYTQPGVDGDLDDPRLTDTGYTTSTTQRELTISVGGMWRFLPAGERFNAYAGLVGRIWLLETITNGESGGASFLENRETSTRYGGALFGGGEIRLGPGAGVVEIDFGGSDLPHLVTGDVATTSLALSLGYRLML